MEVAGSNAGRAFQPFHLLHGDCSIRVSQPHNLQLFGFCLVTITVNAIFF